jgi:ElaB/YqjD/DUF883 family membrane-anchored ribosome-binding protein
MSDSGGLADELRSLKDEVARLLSASAEGTFNSHAEALNEQVKTAIDDLGKTLSEQEGHIEAFMTERPVASLASAFAVGVIVGLLLRRH